MTTPWLPLIAAGLGLWACSALLVPVGLAMTAGMGRRAGLLARLVLCGSMRLLVAVFALQDGLFELVKASLTGTILAGALLGLGLAAFAGGLRHGHQYFDREQAGMATTLMVLAVIALALPAIHGGLHPGQPRNGGAIEGLSLAVAGVMLTLYLLSLYYDLVWQARETGHARQGGLVTQRPLLSLGLLPRALDLPALAAGTWLVTLVAFGFLARRFVDAAGAVLARDPAAVLLVGLVAAPLAGNAAEYLATIRAGWHNRMDLALASATDTCRQVALLGVPLLVLGSLALGRPMDLVFGAYELAALAAAALVANLVAQDGVTNWLEGAMLGGVYAVFCLALFWWSGAF
jgi:Ca2+:H+ antiporter